MCNSNRIYLEGYRSLTGQVISFNYVVYLNDSLTLGCGQATAKALEGEDLASGLVGAVDEVDGVKVIDTWKI